MNERLSQQLEFLKKADGLKGINRKTCLLDGTRKENSAEHSWHIMLTAMTIAEHSNENIDLLRVMQMLALHDLGEIGPGDTPHYLKNACSENAERLYAEEIFSLLPKEQGRKYYQIWVEFEAQETAEAKFAAAIDRLWPCIQNYHNGGGSWLEFKVSLQKALEMNRHIAEGSKPLWEYVECMLRDASHQGLMKPPGL